MPSKRKKSDPKTSLPLETVPETAEKLNVSERTVWRLIKAGELPVVRFGDVTRVRPEDREAFVREHLS